MEQIKAFIEKAKSDNELMAKLDALGAKGEEANEVIALAAEYGFTFTAQDYEQAKANPAKTGELSEEDLGAVSGGIFGSKNRYDPNVCPNLTRTRYECVGFMSACFCDHYRTKDTDSLYVYKHDCAIGAFSYVGTGSGVPL